MYVLVMRLTRTARLAACLQTVTVLEEICQMLTSLRDALLHDVHSVNAECQALLASVRAEHDTSSSGQAQLNHVTSHRLDRVHESRLSDYDALTHVPKAIVNDYSDMWET